MIEKNINASMADISQQIFHKETKSQFAHMLQTSPIPSNSEATNTIRKEFAMDLFIQDD